MLWVVAALARFASAISQWSLFVSDVYLDRLCGCGAGLSDLVFGCVRWGLVWEAVSQVLEVLCQALGDGALETLGPPGQVSALGGVFCGVVAVGASQSVEVAYVGHVFGQCSCELA